MKILSVFRCFYLPYVTFMFISSGLSINNDTTLVVYLFKKAAGFLGLIAGVGTPAGVPQ